MSIEAKEQNKKPKHGGYAEMQIHRLKSKDLRHT